MGFRVHSAMLLADATAGATALAARASGARDDEPPEKVQDRDLAWRDASRTGGDLRLLTSIHPAI
jgi:hypothetical protein